MTDKASGHPVPADRPAAPLERREPALERWGGLVIVLLAAAIMLVWTWRTWPDALVDFGRELYLAWQLAEGKTLYTDLAYFNGPLSPYLNALWFRLFGPSILTLVVCNLVILVGLIFMLYHLLAQISNYRAATIACLTFVVVFAFGQTSSVANYNYLCPYSHEMTHGLTLSVAAILLLGGFQRRRKLVWLCAAGCALGLVFLTKAELFLAAVLAVAVGLSLSLWIQRAAPRRATLVLGCFLIAALLPVAAAFVLLSRAMPAAQALRGTLGSWTAVMDPELTALGFYRRLMGLLDPVSQLKSILLWILGYAAVFVPAAGISLALRRPENRTTRNAAVLFVLALAAVGALLEKVPWLQMSYPLPVIMFLLGVAILAVLLKQPHRPQAAPRRVTQLTMTILAFGLMAKVILKVELHHYGFVLAMPAALVMVVALLAWAPDLIDRRGGYGHAFRAVSLGAWVAVSFALLLMGNHFLRQRTYPVGRGPNLIYANARGPMVAQALEEILARVGPEETLAVLPEGVMLNFLAGRVNPTPYVNFMPPELIIFGEERMLAAFRAHPPDYVVLVGKSTAEYGYRFFGRDYGRNIYAWVQANYRELKLIGAPPLRDDRFGMLIMQRAEPPGA